MNLPPELLALLGPDATPERAAASFEAWASESHPDADFDADEALALYQQALAAAAIRECEAQRAYFSGERAAGKSHDAIWKELNSATKAYDALRNAGRTP